MVKADSRAVEVKFDGMLEIGKLAISMLDSRPSLGRGRGCYPKLCDK